MKRIGDILRAQFEQLPYSKRLLAMMMVLLLPMVLAYQYHLDTNWRYHCRGRCELLAGDFTFRMNEVECLLRGYDPYLIWSGKVKITEGETYLPYSKDGYRDGHTDEGKVIHSYPPWSYTMAMPFMLVPEDCRYAVFTIFECLIVFCLLYWFFRHSRETGGELAAVITIAVSSIAIPYVGSCLFLGNYGIVIAGAIWLALLLHSRGHHSWAGVAWASTMIKPQIGLLFFLVLLALRQWRTIFVGGSLVALLSLPPAFICGRSPVDMILAIKDYTSVDIFHASGIITPGLRDVLLKYFGASSPLWFGLAIGGFAGIYLSLRLAKSRDWFLTFLPAIIFSTLWAAGGWDHDHAIDLVELAIVGTQLLRAARRSELIAYITIAGCIFFHRWGTWPLPLPDLWSLVIVMMFVFFVRMEEDLR